jgi:OmpA family protein
MRRTYATLVVAVLAPGCAHRKATDGDPQLRKDALFATTDPRFYEEDPATQYRCHADKDCPAGSMCHPGTFVCFSSYPLPGMVDVKIDAKVKTEGGCPLVRVYFPPNSVDLVEDARRWLEYDARCLTAFPRKRVILAAHSDAKGNADYNMKLSRRRGDAVKEFLQQHGVEVPIEVIGRGEEDPLKHGRSELDYAFNRRVEFLVE